MKIRLMTTFVLFLLLLSTGLFMTEAGPSPVSISYTLNGNRSCSATQFAIMGVEHDQLRSTPPQFSALATLNGQFLNKFTGTWGNSGVGDVGFAGFIGPQVFTPGSNTYAYHRTVVYAYNNQVFETLDFSFSCVAGTVQNVSVQEDYQPGPYTPF